MVRGTVPNIISVARIVVSPGMIGLACLGRGTLFIVVFGACLFSDFLDGLFARAFGQTSPAGARLDTWGDLTMYGSAAAGGAVLWPGLVGREGPYIAAALALVALSGLVSLLKHRRLPAYHTWSAKLSTAAIGVAALVMFAGLSPWPFRVSVAALAVSAAEEIGITLLMPEWKPNVKSLARALALRGSKEPPGADGS